MKAVGLVACVMAAAALAGAAAAGNSTSGTGTSTVVTQTVTISSHGPNTILDVDATRVLTGVLAGTVVEHLQDTIHPSGVVTVKGAGTFTGTLAGCGATTYTIPFSVEGHVVPAGDLTAGFQSVGNNAGWFHGEATGLVTSTTLQVSAVVRC